VDVDADGHLYGYAHTGVAEGLKVGQVVKGGDQIGYSNATGKTPTGESVSPHLHMTFRAASSEFAPTMRTPYSNPNHLFQRLRLNRDPD